MTQFRPPRRAHQTTSAGRSRVSSVQRSKPHWFCSSAVDENDSTHTPRLGAFPASRSSLVDPSERQVRHSDPDSSPAAENIEEHIRMRPVADKNRRQRGRVARKLWPRGGIFCCRLFFCRACERCAGWTSIMGNRGSIAVSYSLAWHP
jgi:hypothetical protein